MRDKGTYRDKLKDPRWQKKRLEIISAANWACEDCGRRDLEIHVHHCAYVRALEPWQYGHDLLMALCADCHNFRQDREEGMRVALGRVTRFLKKRNLDSETWRLVNDIQLRETERLASAFTLDGE